MTVSQDKGADYERFISELIQNVESSGRKIRDIRYGRKNTIPGASGCNHQIDVCFFDESFPDETLVLIECKSTPSRSASVKKSQIATFKAIIDDISLSDKSPKKVKGLFAYATKAQSGALKFAKFYDILMEKTGTRPNFAFKYCDLVLLGAQIRGKSDASGDLSFASKQS